MFTSSKLNQSLYLTLTLAADMSQFSLRAATKRDVPSLVKLCKDTLVDVYGPIMPWENLQPWVEGELLRDSLEKQWQNMVVAEVNGQVVGVVSKYDDLVGLLWVHPSHHRKGIGRALLEFVEAQLKDEGRSLGHLNCFSDNRKALAFYLANGWKAAGERMNEEAGILEINMVRDLSAK